MGRAFLAPCGSCEGRPTSRIRISFFARLPESQVSVPRNPTHKVDTTTNRGSHHSPQPTAKKNENDESLTTYAPHVSSRRCVLPLTNLPFYPTKLTPAASTMADRFLMAVISQGRETTFNRGAPRWAWKRPQLYRRYFAGLCSPRRSTPSVDLQLHSQFPNTL